MEGTYYVLRRDSVATKTDRSSSYSYGRSTSRPISVVAKSGSLWKSTECYHDQQASAADGLYEPVAAVRASATVPTVVVVRSCADGEHDVQMQCSLRDLHRLQGDAEYQLLAAVDDPAERLRLLETDPGGAQLRDGCRMMVAWNDSGRTGGRKKAGRTPEMSVFVYSGPKKQTGVVRYIGPVLGRSGVVFGVELSPQYHGLGTTNGCVRDKYYFTCDDGCGIFVAVNQIALRDMGNVEDIDIRKSHCRNLSNEHGDSFRSGWTPSPDESPEMMLLPRPPLEIGERVVWISDTGPEVGTVRWIGILPDCRIKEYTIGVEFDNAIGTGTGKYNNKQLFRTQQNHASLIPVLGLMKAEEFFGSAADVPPSPFANDTVLSSVTYKPQDVRNSTRIDPSVTKSSRPDDTGDEICHTHESHLTFSSRGSHLERSNHIAEDIVDQRGMNDIDRRSVGRSGRNSVRTVKVADSHSLPVTQLAECSVTERSIYDREPEHSYENVEKDESGRLLNRDTLAFRMVDSVPDKALGSGRSNSGDDMSSGRGLVTQSSERRTAIQGAQGDGSKSVASTIHRSSRSVDNIFTDNAGQNSTPEKTQGEASHVEQLPYHTGRSTFYKRVEEGDAFVAPPQRQNSGPAAVTSTGMMFTSLNDKSAKQSTFVSPGVSPTRSKDRANMMSTTSLRSTESVKSSSRLLTTTPYVTDRVNSANSVTTSAIIEKNTKSPELSPATSRHLPTEPMDSAEQMSDKRFDDVDVIPKTLSHCELTDTDLDIGSVVEFDIGNVRHYGVIRWIGYLTDKRDPIAGIELEEETPDGVDGMLGHTRLFECAPNKGFFEHLHNLCKDRRFTESSKFTHRMPNQLFGSIECIDVPGIIGPPAFDQRRFLGPDRGIQGHHNSCYMDATLFGMFAFSMVFDAVLHRPKRLNGDIKRYNEVQAALRDGIVNPLRKNFYVRADKVLHLRQLLDESSSVQGLMSEEKDPEEFLNSLLQQTLKADPFIRLSSGQDSYFYQLFMDKDDRVLLPTTQQLLELSFLQSDVKLSEIPSCLILQMPRFGKDYKMYRRIVPSLFLDITDILQYGIRECAICGNLATHECKNCFREFGDGLDKIAFCDICLNKSHSRNKRSGHRPSALPPNPDYKDYSGTSTDGQQTDRVLDVVSESLREKMELFAVICIETSHYVAFVKTGSGLQAPWVFFDSMADRKGEQHGYNVPSTELCHYLPSWLADNSFTEIHRHREDRDLPEQMRRLLCDAYICMYQSCSLAEYR